MLKVATCNPTFDREVISFRMGLFLIVIVQPHGNQTVSFLSLQGKEIVESSNAQIGDIGKVNESMSEINLITQNNNEQVSSNAKHSPRSASKVA